MSLKIIFAGTPEFSCRPFTALINSSHKIQAVYTQPDKPAGRGKRIHESPVKQLAKKHDIPVYQPKSLKNEDEQNILRKLNPDVIIVVAYGLILPEKVLKIPKYGCINIHASLLPRWRGAAPIQQAILAGDNTTGISIMQMDKGLDTGDVLSTYIAEITPSETSQSLHDKLAQIGAHAILETLEKLEKNRLLPQKQNDQHATYASKILKEDAKINWQEAASFIERKIRAYYPWPIAFTMLAEKPIRIWSATVLKAQTDAPYGTIIATSKEGIDVTTGQGVLRILELQLPGGNKLAVKEILNSKKSLFELGHCFN